MKSNKYRATKAAILGVALLAAVATLMVPISVAIVDATPLTDTINTSTSFDDPHSSFSGSSSLPLSLLSQLSSSLPSLSATDRDRAVNTIRDTLQRLEPQVSARAQQLKARLTTLLSQLESRVTSEPRAPLVNIEVERGDAARVDDASSLSPLDVNHAYDSGIASLQPRASSDDVELDGADPFDEHTDVASAATDTDVDAVELQGGTQVNVINEESDEQVPSIGGGEVDEVGPGGAVIVQPYPVYYPRYWPRYPWWRRRWGRFGGWPGRRWGRWGAWGGGRGRWGGRWGSRWGPRWGHRGGWGRFGGHRGSGRWGGGGARRGAW